MQHHVHSAGHWHMSRVSVCWSSPTQAGLGVWSIGAGLSDSGNWSKGTECVGEGVMRPRTFPDMMCWSTRSVFVLRRSFSRQLGGDAAEPRQRHDDEPYGTRGEQGDELSPIEDERSEQRTEDVAHGLGGVEQPEHTSAVSRTCKSGRHDRLGDAQHDLSETEDDDAEGGYG